MTLSNRFSNSLAIALDHAHAAGFEACRLGDSQQNNPYGNEPELYDAWLDGWEDARDRLGLIGCSASSGLLG